MSDAADTHDALVVARNSIFKAYQVLNRQKLSELPLDVQEVTNALRHALREAEDALISAEGE